MNPDLMLATAAARTRPWDVVIIGGGATGAGCAVDAASRGYCVLLLERGEFGSGTSSRSTKLVHGGVRYLARGELGLVTQALHERAMLRRNAPHVVKPLAFVVPAYRWWERAWYGLGLTAYDLLAGSEGFGRTEFLSREQTLRRLPNLASEGLRGGVLYFDGQFDDARLLADLIATAADHGACVLNRTEAIAFTRDRDGRIDGVIARPTHPSTCSTDPMLEPAASRTIRARVVINAAGPFGDAVRRMAPPAAVRTSGSTARSSARIRP